MPDETSRLMTCCFDPWLQQQVRLTSLRNTIKRIGLQSKNEESNEIKQSVLN